MYRLLFLLAFTSINIVSAQQADTLLQHREEYRKDLFKNLGIDTSRVSFYPFNKALVVIAKVEVLKDQPVFKMTTSSGMKKDAQRFARLTFTYKGKVYTCTGYQLSKLKESTEFADHFFIPFRDQTNGITTYGAGRYLDFTTADIKNGKLTIDFNKAYNPYCAFADGYNCPIPPKENHLKLKVNAGEQMYTGERKVAE